MTDAVCRTLSAITHRIGKNYQGFPSLYFVSPAECLSEKGEYKAKGVGDREHTYTRQKTGETPIAWLDLNVNEGMMCS